MPEQMASPMLKGRAASPTVTTSQESPVLRLSFGRQSRASTTVPQAISCSMPVAVFTVTEPSFTAVTVASGQKRTPKAFMLGWVKVFTQNE